MFEILDEERQFYCYFDRCYDIGMTEMEIRKNFKYLNKLYKKTIPILKRLLYNKSLENAYITWKRINNAFNLY